MNIRVVQSGGETQVMINDVDVSSRCVDVNSFSKPGELTQVVITFEPESFTIESV